MEADSHVGDIEMHELPPDDRPERNSEEESGDGKQKILKRLEEAAEGMEEFQDTLVGKRRSPASGVTDTGVSCPHECGGTVQKDVSYQYFGDVMHRVIGPGGRQQQTCVVRYYCSKCATLFHHIPE